MKKNKVLFLILASLGMLPGLAQNGVEKYSWNNLPKSELPEFRRDTFNIINYGSRADGTTLNTESINKAINDCSAKGGGVVVIPQGIWLTGPLIMKSNVNLHVRRSALLQFSADKNQYHLIKGNFEGHQSIRNESPISGTDLTNIAITGDGVIDGHGEVWRAMGKDRVTEAEWQQITMTGSVSGDGKMWYPSDSYAKGAMTKNAGYVQPDKSLTDYVATKDFFRPNMVVLNNCKKVLLQNVTFQNSPAWCLHTLLCENLTFDGVHVRNQPNAQNGDGIDIESCSYVLVENCTLDCGDDGICIKSGKDEEGRKVAKASQYIVVRNNVVYKAHGGFVIGSEMSGGAHDIFVYGCTFIGTDNGLRFKTVRGRGGIVENIFIKDIIMHDILHDAVLFDMYYFTKAPSLEQTKGKVEIPAVNDGTPQFRNFFISNLVCEGAERAILVRGLPEMSIKNIFFENIFARALKGADIVEAENVHLNKVIFQCQQTIPLINIENSHEIVFDKIESPTLPELFFSVSGDRSKQIMVRNTVLTGIKPTADFKFGADKSNITFSK